MGIKNLNKLIKENAPNSIKEVKDLTELDGWYVGVDASLIIYQMCSVGIKYNIKNRDGLFIHHIQGIFFRVVNMIIAGIHPTFVFDSKPPELKTEAIAKRKLARDLGATRVPREVFIEVRKLLALMGIGCIDAASEAEAEIAALIKSGVLDAAVTEDTDCLTFGAKYMIRGGTDSKKTTITELKKLLDGLKITYAQFVDLCILLGSDYNPSFPKMGPKRALLLIQKYKSIESIIKNEKLDTTIDFLKVRNEFLNPNVTNAKFDPEIKILTAVDIKKLRDYLINVHKLDESRINKTLNNLATYHNIV